MRLGWGSLVCAVALVLTGCAPALDAEEAVALCIEEAERGQWRHDLDRWPADGLVDAYETTASVIDSSSDGHGYRVGGETRATFTSGDAPVTVTWGCLSQVGDRDVHTALYEVD